MLGDALGDNDMALIVWEHFEPSMPLFVVERLHFQLKW